MTMFKSLTGFLPILLVIYQPTTSAQTVGLDDKPRSIRSASEAADAATALEETAVPVISQSSALDKTRYDPRALFSVFEIVDQNFIDRKVNYVAAIDLTNPLKPVLSGRRETNVGGHVFFGLRRPYYRLDETIRVIGSFDLKANGSLAGLGNSATVTFRYDFFGNTRSRAFKISMLVDQFSYRIIIPLGQSPE